LSLCNEGTRSFSSCECFDQHVTQKQKGAKRMWVRFVGNRETSTGFQGPSTISDWWFLSNWLDYRMKIDRSFFSLWGARNSQSINRLWRQGGFRLLEWLNIW
jgi:hypothetical protein